MASDGRLPAVLDASRLAGDRMPQSGAGVVRSDVGRFEVSEEETERNRCGGLLTKRRRKENKKEREIFKWMKEA